VTSLSIAARGRVAKKKPKVALRDLRGLRFFVTPAIVGPSTGPWRASSDDRRL
jgi:hypothetical protein